MISNERPSPYGQRPPYGNKPPVAEDTLKSDKIQIERKTFVFTLKENPHEFFRIEHDGFDWCALGVYAHDIYL